MEKIDLLHKTVSETANASLTLNPTATGWNCYLTAQKKKFDNPNLPTLCDEVSKYIVENRVVKESTTSNKPGANKPFKLP